MSHAYWRAGSGLSSPSDPSHADSGRDICSTSRRHTVTKHAAIGFSVWLAATYDDQGIGVSVLCPAAVLTPILAGQGDTPEGPRRDHHGRADRHRHSGASRGALHHLTHPWVL